MATRSFDLEGVGQIQLVKRRGSRNLRLTITPKGVIKVNMPIWAPYSAGISFAANHADWIRQQAAKAGTGELRNGDTIGKSHRLFIEYDAAAARTTSRIEDARITVKTPLNLASDELQTKLAAISEKALRSQAEALLPERLDYLAKTHGFDYKRLKFKRLTSRWGSCATDGTITLSVYLIQLPWPLIDYVLLHELLHTRHMHHGKGFWADFEAILPGARQTRKAVHRYRPRVEPIPLAAR